MRARMVFKIMFVVILVLILIGLIFIIFDKAGTRAGVRNTMKIVDYTIVNEQENCADVLELIYEDADYKYYLPCISSYGIYLEWSDGTRDLLKDALRNGKVTMDSLIDHGLDVYKNAR